jgi:hypothetical protein
MQTVELRRRVGEGSEGCLACSVATVYAVQTLENLNMESDYFDLDDLVLKLLSKLKKA